MTAMNGDQWNKALRLTAHNSALCVVCEICVHVTQNIVLTLAAYYKSYSIYAYRLNECNCAHASLNVFYVCFCVESGLVSMF